MSVVYEPEHGERAVERVLSQFWDRPRFMAFVRTLAHGAQLVEDSIWSAMVDRLLDGATGSTLELYGELVGEPRSGSTDTEYRRFITARLLALRSSGGLADAKQVFDLVIEGATEVSVLEPFTVRWTATPSEPMSSSLRGKVRRIMAVTRGQGREFRYVEARAGSLRCGVTPGLGVGTLGRSF